MTGVLYMATGDEFLIEAARSADSVREHAPHVEVAIATDHDDPPGDWDHVLSYDFHTETLNGRSWLLNSTVPPDLSPFDRTLVLDSDTLVVGDIMPIFDALEHYELAVSSPTGQPSLDCLPDSMRRLNCGVIAYRDTPPVRNLLLNWRSQYRADVREGERPVDQPSFARVLHQSGVRWLQLPDEYNVRVPQRGSITTDPKILHGRHPAGLRQAAKELQKVDGPRVYWQQSARGSRVFRVRNRGSWRYHAVQMVKQHGIGGVLRTGVAYCLDRIDGRGRLAERDVG